MARPIAGSKKEGGDSIVFQDFGRFDFDPFVEMRRMQNEMNRLLSDYATPATQEFPPLNLWLSENGVVVAAELPEQATAW